MQKNKLRHVTVPYVLKSVGLLFAKYLPGANAFWSLSCGLCLVASAVWPLPGGICRVRRWPLTIIETWLRHWLPCGLWRHEGSLWVSFMLAWCRMIDWRPFASDEGTAKCM